MDGNKGRVFIRGCGGSVCSLHLFLEERLILFHFKGCIYMPIHVYIIYMCMHIFKKFKY